MARYGSVAPAWGGEPGAALKSRNKRTSASASAPRRLVRLGAYTGILLSLGLIAVVTVPHLRTVDPKSLVGLVEPASLAAVGYGGHDHRQNLPDCEALEDLPEEVCGDVGVITAILMGWRYDTVPACACHVFYDTGSQDDLYLDPDSYKYLDAKVELVSMLVPAMTGLVTSPVSPFTQSILDMSSDLILDVEDDPFDTSSCTCLEDCLVATSPLARNDCSQPVCVSFLFAPDVIGQCLVNPDDICYTCAEACKIENGIVTAEEALEEREYLTLLLGKGASTLATRSTRGKLNRNSMPTS
jgi:hypothetical protein